MRPHAFAASVLFMVPLACNNQPGAPSSKNQPGVSVVIDPSITPQSLRSLALGSETLGVIESNQGTGAFLAEQLVIKLASQNRAQSLTSLLAKRNAQLLNDNKLPIPPTSIPKSELRPVPDRGYRLIGLTPPVADKTRLAERLARAGFQGEVKFSSDAAAHLFNSILTIRQDDTALVEHAEPNWVLEPTTVYYDHNFSPAGTYLASTNNDALTNLNLSQAGGAWDYKYGGVPVDGRGVQIAVIDAGFDPNNYDMTGYDPTLGYAPYTRTVWQYDFNQNDYDVSVGPTEDCVGSSASCYHGLHSAAAAAGIRGNHYGAAGSAPRADLFLFRATGYWLGWYFITFYNAARAVDTAIYWGADVINMSLTWSGTVCGELLICYLGSSVVNAKNNGLIVLASAGNNNCRNDFNNGNTFPCYNSPGMWADVIGVGAHDRFFYRSWWSPSDGSAYGASVDIWAPGGGGYARSYGDKRLYSTPSPQSSACYSSGQCWLVSNSDRMFQYSGTSASSPYAAGVAALMKQIRPWITQAEVISIMQSTGWIGPDPEVGKILDARAAIHVLGAHP